MPCVLIIENHRYDVTSYIPKHPGEGIRNIFLQDFNGKDVTVEFDHYHMTDHPFQFLEKVREKGEYLGIKYLGISK